MSTAPDVTPPVFKFNSSYVTTEDTGGGGAIERVNASLDEEYNAGNLSASNFPNSTLVTSSPSMSEHMVCLGKLSCIAACMHSSN